MAKFHETYVGSGDIYIREVGAEEPLAKFANITALNLSGEEETKSARAGKGNAIVNEIRRVSAVNASISCMSFSAHELAIALRATFSEVASGTVTAEAHTAYKGGLIRTAFIGLSAVNVEPAGGGTAYTPVTDYEVVAGGIFIPETSSIADGTDIEIDYTYGAQDIIEAFVNSGKEYEMAFDGLNEADSGRPVIVDFYRFKPGILNELPLYGDDFANYTIEGALLADTSKAVGKSQYYKVHQRKG